MEIRRGRVVRYLVYDVKLEGELLVVVVVVEFVWCSGATALAGLSRATRGAHLAVGAQGVEVETVFAGEDSTVANGPSCMGHVEGCDVLIGLDGSVSTPMSPGAEAEGCGALVVGELWQVQVLRPGGVVEPCVVHTAELSKRACGLEIIFDAAVDVV